MTWDVNITVKDEAGKSSVMTVHFEHYADDVPAFNTFDNIESAINELLPFIDNMINGQITRVCIAREIPLSGLKLAPNGSSDVEEKGVFIFTTAFGRVRVTLPTFKDSLVVVGTDDIDQTNADVVSFIFRMTDGSSTPLEFVRPSDNRDEKIIGFIDAYEAFKSRKR